MTDLQVVQHVVKAIWREYILLAPWKTKSISNNPFTECLKHPTYSSAFELQELEYSVTDEQLEDKEMGKLMR